MYLGYDVWLSWSKFNSSIETNGAKHIQFLYLVSMFDFVGVSLAQVLSQTELSKSNILCLYFLGLQSAAVC